MTDHVGYGLWLVGSMVTSPSPFQAHRSSFHPGRQDPYLRLGTVSVFVRDQERSLRFFLEQLGFTLAFDTQLPSGERWLAVSPPDGTAVLTLVAPTPRSEDYARIGRSAQITFLTENVARKFEEWRARGVRFLEAPETQPGGAISARLEDPDGNSFTLLSYQELISEIESQRRAYGERLEAENRAAREREFARAVQARLLPQSPPALHTLDCAGVCIQAREVGGDYYDFLDLGRERMGLVIGDISGKGTAAALLMANLQAHLRSQCPAYWSRPYTPIALGQPQRLLCSVNQLFHQNTCEGTYATLFFAEYDDSAKLLRYANCGHLPGLVLSREGKLERLEPTCTVLGLFREWDCSVGERSLSPGDMVALFTDGIVEARNHADEEFGELRLIDALLENQHLPSANSLAAVLDALWKFNPNREQRDDVTLLFARCKEN
jgi:serine phosphatase RsbU (regulator of sigma subunit)/catechol 2,3-dioxygenase-like lactoylglutathione lyase family enzyme